MTRPKFAAAVRANWVAVLGGLIFLAIFQWRYTGIDPEFFQFRDDGVITLSHARNWVDFGFIGVNPSGDRIEASSAPLQLLLYAVAYGLTGVDYRAFMTLQTLVCTFGIGFLFAKIFPGRPVVALALTAGAAALLTRLASFVVWHGSGMENALTHVFLLWTVWVLYAFARNDRIDMRWAVIPFLASVVRVDGVLHVAPLLFVFCLYWQVRHADRRGWLFAFFVGVAWALFNAARALYFGSLLPNTAVAQGISVGERLIELVTLSPIYLDQAFGLARIVFSRHGGYLLLLTLPFIVLRQKAGAPVLLLVLALTIVLTSLATPFIFGAARLDTTRTTTQMALFVVVAVAAAISQWEPRRADRYSIPITVLLVFVIHEWAFTTPYRACCSVQEFDRIRVAFVQIAKEEEIARPTVANPDLGVMSWHKQFNIVDLGLLGSPLVARLDPEQPRMARYFFDYAAPDIIETHEWWSCRYAAVFTHPRFAATYVRSPIRPAQTAACKGAPQVPAGVWVRRDVMHDSASPERLLMVDLARGPTIERLTREMDACVKRASPDAAACAYIARSAYRVLPEFRAQGDQARLEELFARSPSRQFDLYLLKGAGNARAWREALEYLERSP